MFYRISAAAAASGLLLCVAAHAAPPVVKANPKAPVKTLLKTPLARIGSETVGSGRQLPYTSSSMFSPSGRVMRTERQNVLRGEKASLWDSDRSDEARRLQRRAEMRARREQQRSRLQKESRDAALRKAASR